MLVSINLKETFASASDRELKDLIKAAQFELEWRSDMEPTPEELELVKDKNVSWAQKVLKVSRDRAISLTVTKEFVDRIRQMFQ